MSDLHHLPLCPHDMPGKPAVRAKVYGFRSVFNTTRWYWYYLDEHQENTVTHGPFESWRESYDSARRMVELL